jgi:hypothetical protein
MQERMRLADALAHELAKIARPEVCSRMVSRLRELDAALAARVVECLRRAPAGGAGRGRSDPAWGLDAKLVEILEATFGDGCTPPAACACRG